MLQPSPLLDAANSRQAPLQALEGLCFQAEVWRQGKVRFVIRPRWQDTRLEAATDLIDELDHLESKVYACRLLALLDRHGSGNI